ncbi:MAG: DUF1244 domain-containing protein [bacterium]
MSEKTLSADDQMRIEAAAFRRLLAHLDERKDVQNIDLMILAGFCRNCLSKWYKAAADELQVDIDLETAREKVYGMTYAQWKEKHQREATPEQLAAMEAAANH